MSLLSMWLADSAAFASAIVSSAAITSATMSSATSLGADVAALSPAEPSTSALLSRIQFAFTVSVHIMFPSMTIGLATLIAWWEAMWLKTKDPVYLQLAKFWIKPFAITFGMGVVSGVVLSYEFGTNFSTFSDIVGAVIGPLMAYEVLTAFFLEAGFLGVMLFGWQKVSPRLHFTATLTVAIGTWISAFWIIIANSWMHTPQGAELIDGRFVVQDWWAVIFNPSMPYRFTHMLLASFLTATFVVMATSAWQLRKNPDAAYAKKALSMTLGIALILAPLQAFVGDLHGLNVKEHQPVKLAAMEGIWPEKSTHVPLLLFAIPDQAAETNHASIGIPRLASLILTHSVDGELTGLTAVPPSDRPNVAMVFYSFRVMVGIGILMIIIACWGNWLRWRGRLYQHPRFLAVTPWMAPSGIIAVLAGWYVVEIGRQPWVVQGLIRTNDVVSPVPSEKVALSLLLFVTVYCVLIGVYVYFMRKLIHKGPPPLEDIHQFKVGHAAAGYAAALQHDASTGPAKE